MCAGHTEVASICFRAYHNASATWQASRVGGNPWSTTLSGDMVAGEAALRTENAPLAPCRRGHICDLARSDNDGVMVNRQ